jgi:hypothetical protein
MKDLNQAINEDFDFGFSSVDQLPPSADESKAQRMYKMIVPLLDNLLKDADTHEYIRWPNRAAKLTEFHGKLEAILNE